jgi:hypothetical protein
MTKLTETQTIILSAGAQRPENIALPLPKGLAGAAAKMAVTKMIERGWLQEVDAKIRRGEPLWRETGDGHGTTLVVTDAGLLAIGIEPVVVQTMTAIHNDCYETPKPLSHDDECARTALLQKQFQGGPLHIYLVRPLAQQIDSLPQRSVTFALHPISTSSLPKVCCSSFRKTKALVVMSAPLCPSLI